MLSQVSKITSGILLIFILLFQQFAVGSEAGKTVADTAVSDAEEKMLSAPVDTLQQVLADTIPADTNVAATEVLKSKIVYHAKDSIRVNIEDEIVHLYGDATVDYEELHLEANYIEINMNEKEMFARGTKDSAGAETGTPQFSQGDQKFRSNGIHYNFQTKKGKINYVITQQGDGYIHGETVKKDPENNFFIRNGQYTTCDLDTPHFAITSNRLKVISKNKIVTGPAYLTIEQIPTPILIPFGFFPNKSGRSSGILIPAFGESAQRGFYFQKLGYYFGFNDYLNLALTTDLYTKGSYTVDATMPYKKRYRYSGRLYLSYAYTINSEKELPDYSLTKDYHINWTHTQDAKANPNSTFSASVNAGTTSYYQNTISSLGNYLTNTFISSINYSYSFPDKPVNYSIAASHSQNTFTHVIRITAPDLSFNISRLNPFKRKVSIGLPKWYEKIGTSVSIRGTNYIETFDSLLFSENPVPKLKNGIQVSVPLSTSFNIFKYYNFTPSINYTERTYLKTTQYRWDPEAQKTDTLEIERLQTSHDYSFSAGLSTRIYGMYLFRKGPVTAIRHVITPAASISYRPDFGQPKYGYYKTVQTDSTGRTSTYSIFQNSVYGGPSNGRYANLSYSLDNNIEMKVKTSSDTGDATKKIKLLESLKIGGGYNFIADSMKLSVFSLSARTTLFDRVSVNYSSTLDPYAFDENNNDYDRFQYALNKKLLRLTTANLSFNFSLTNAKTLETSNKYSKEEIDYINQHPDEYIDFKVPYNLSVGYAYSYSRHGAQTSVTTQTASLQGDLSLTSKWKVGFNSWYNVTEGKFTSFSTNIYRDLHCWEMRLNWIPFGGQESYSFQINVKAAILQDLKLLKKKDFYDR